MLAANLVSGEVLVVKLRMGMGGMRGTLILEAQTDNAALRAQLSRIAMVRPDREET